MKPSFEVGDKIEPVIHLLPTIRLGEGTVEYNRAFGECGFESTMLLLAAIRFSENEYECKADEILETKAGHLIAT